MDGERSHQLVDYGPVIAAAEPLHDAAVLVGGQSVYVWADYYRARRPELDAFLPFTTKDATSCDRIETPRNPAPFPALYRAL